MVESGSHLDPELFMLLAEHPTAQSRLQRREEPASPRDESGSENRAHRFPEPVLA